MTDSKKFAVQVAMLKVAVVVWERSSVFSISDRAGLQCGPTVAVMNLRKDVGGRKWESGSRNEVRKLKVRVRVRKHPGSHRSDNNLTRVLLNDNDLNVR